jgi:hypothetical protein
VTTVALVTKNTIVELMLLGLAQSPLKDLGLDAMRGVLASDPRLAVLDGSVDVETVWELLEGQPDFNADAAVAPFCFLKSLEPRLQIIIRLPKKLANLTETEIIKYAGQCRPTRENVDRVIERAALKESAPRPKAKYDQTTPLFRPLPSLQEDLTLKKKILAGVSAVVVLASVIIVGYTLFSEMASEPKYTRIDTALFAGEIPLRSAEKWGGEVHASLSDANWLRQPEDKKRKQIETALQRLGDQQLSVLIIEDDAKKARAVGQVFGKPPKVYVRFY